MIKRFVTKKCSLALQRDDWMTASKRKRNESTLWQRRFWERQIRDDRDYEKHMIPSLQSGKARSGKKCEGLASFNIPSLCT